MKLTQSIAKLANAAVTAVMHVAANAPLIGKVFARFEAAYTNWGARRWLWTSYQDARFEIDFAASMEICRKYLYFCENNWIVRRIEWLRVQYAVSSSGLQVTPDVSDTKLEAKELEDWVNVRMASWEKFCKSPDISNNLTMGQLTILWERQLFRVGNIIVIKTVGENGQLAIQTIDRLRLQTPTQFASEEGKTVCQGIRLKKISVPTVVIQDGKRIKVMKEVVTGKPECYYIRDEFEMDKFAEVPAENVIHKFDCLMPGQMVGIPDGHAAINLLHDYEDLQILEMGAAKLAGKIGNVTRNRTGEFSGNTARTSRLTITGVDQAGTATSKNALYDYNVSVGAQDIALMHGDDINNFMIKRPTVAQQDYWDLLLNQIFMAHNVPRLLGAPYSLQGTVTRLDVAVSRDAFLRDYELVAAVLREIYEWWSERDVRHNTANYGKKIPADHNACEIHPPDSPDVDIGYSAAGQAIELENGTTNIAQVLGRRKKNWRNVIDQTGQIEQCIDNTAKKYGIDSSRISSKLFKTGRALAQEGAEIDDTGGEVKTENKQ